MKRSGLLICLLNNYPKPKSIFSQRVLTSQLLLKQFPNKEFIATIVNAVKDLGNKGTHAIRARLSLVLQNSKLPKYNISKSGCKALKQI